MFVLVGLGNPGERYQKTRHNIGFMAVDEIASGYGNQPWQTKFQSLIMPITIPAGGGKGLLVKPQTYMNCSGQAVGELLRYYKLNNQQLFVIYDDLALPLAKVRVKRGGGSGGHNGIRSIDQYCGVDYTRVRVGIDHPGAKIQVADYVLQPFGKEELNQVDNLLPKLAAHVSLLLAGQESSFMNQLIL